MDRPVDAPKWPEVVKEAMAEYQKQASAVMGEQRLAVDSLGELAELMYGRDSKTLPSAEEVKPDVTVQGD